MSHDSAPFLIVLALAFAAPLVADLLGRRIPVPTVVVELLLGVLVGPSVLDRVHEGDVLNYMADFGLAFLMFLAGFEIEPARLSGRPLRRATLGWALSLVVGLLLGLLLVWSGSTMSRLVVGLALTTTALGTLLPILRDAGALPTRFGAQVMAIGTLGEFGPIVAVSLLLSGRNADASAIALTCFAAVTVVVFAFARRPLPGVLDRVVQATLHSSGQLAIRLAVLVLALLVWAADELGLDALLGAFAAGLVFRLLLSDLPAEARETVAGKLDGIGFGLFVPVFFVISGVRFDGRALFADLGTFALLPLFLVLLPVVRGAPTYLMERGSPAAVRRGLALFASAGLPLIVVITGIGVEEGELRAGTAAAMVGAGMVSVLVFPLLGMRAYRGAVTVDPALAER
ncbi:cation:proton antiporter [Embleya scabrispora]|uniref:cation:proton antiporter n=1 Tax=Embleya scabrispora TaxID=159449 RepID=UPI000369C91D|nr:cation:proton antiporter [Embleya scabrispora]MYS87221.1 cation:proton antiporter [Streptomyces sp. SID5474]